MTVNWPLVQQMKREIANSLTALRSNLAETSQEPMSRENEKAYSLQLISDTLEKYAVRFVRDGQRPPTVEEEEELSDAVYNSLWGMGRLQPYLDRDDLTDIMVRGTHPVHLWHKDGSRSVRPPVAESDDELITLIRMAATRMGRTEKRFDEASPELNLQLPGGDRLHAVMRVSSAPHLTIRRHQWDIGFLENLAARGMIDRSLELFLRACVLSCKNLIVSGGVAMGKTTMLRALINEIPPHERIITIEDNLEIGLEHFEEFHPNFESLETADANVEGKGEIPMTDLTRMGLRMSPDRVIVGEVRGKEILPMLLAMTQGNDGSMCTIHAESAKGVIERITLYALMSPDSPSESFLPRLIANAIDFIVQIGIVDGVRCVRSVFEVTGGDTLVRGNDVWVPDEIHGRAVPHTPISNKNLIDLEAAGFDRTLLKPDGWWDLS